MMTWYPIIMLVFRLASLFQDKKGKSPGWVVRLTGAMFRGVWISYDGFFKRVFGDGERTQGQEDGGDDRVGREGAEGEKGEGVWRVKAMV